uniref:Mitochondrial ribosomal protein S6 n=1 Tax=Polytomella parva TaxID=51329 RepID=A0A7S0YER5_9CHLO|mmetsp:Transcript_2253/g.3416  ORF Transcript_2253/g.3416 Transcript_2253/m.3416 type:complete len:125 (+) Transcript_2253:40-414(+)
MPLYELLCLVKPLAKPEVATLMKGVGQRVLSKGGFITEVQSYGEQQLAYDIRRPFERYPSAHIFKMEFAAPTDSVAPLINDFKINEKFLRWVILKRPTYKRTIEELMEEVKAQENEEAKATQSA